MACDKRSSGIVLEGMNITFGAKSTVCITPVYPLVESSHFLISSVEANYYVWVNDGAGVDPAVANRTGIEVDTSSATNESEVVDAIITAMEAGGEFWVTKSTDGLSASCQNKSIGPSADVAADVDTTFELHTDKVGFGGDLGKTEAMELSMEVTSFDVTANQSGEIVLDKFVTGLSAELTTSLLQLTAENWENIIGNGLGGNHTPTAGTVVTGYGQSSINKSFFEVAGTLVLHPVRLDASDKSRDITLHQCVAQPSSINFDSTEKQAMEVAFTALLDGGINEAINLFCFGDSSQDLR